jgi:hypothetical protein
MHSSPGLGRYERKFLVPPSAWSGVETHIRLNPALFRDIYHPRTINNLYLDSPALDLYFMNVAGNAERVKVRIRWYGELFGPIPQPVLEFKFKNGLLGTKQSFPLPPFQLDDQFTVTTLKTLLDQAVLPASVRRRLPGLKPALVNRYQRKYYQSADRQYRLTWDTGLEFFRVRAGRNALFFKAGPCPHQVIELKYDHSVWEGAERITSALPFRLSRMSKYVFGLDSLDGF